MQDLPLWDRAHAFLDAFADLPPDRRASLPQALVALDHIDRALHDFRHGPLWCHGVGAVEALLLS